MSMFQGIDRIVLHFDVNGTIIAEDKADGETPSAFVDKVAKRKRGLGHEVSVRFLAHVDHPR